MTSGWSSKYQWCFSNVGTGNQGGVNDVGIGIFKKEPYDGLTREIIQNSRDAQSNPDIPAKVCFELIKVPKNDVPGADRLLDVINKCYEYDSEGDDGRKLKILADTAQEFLGKDDTVPVLKISDYNTYGLKGAKAKKKSNWTGLVREVGSTNKGNGQGGAFGIGKFAPYTVSGLRTILYTTLYHESANGNSPEEDVFAFQGKTILATFEEDGKLKQNVGLFGLPVDDDCMAIYDQSEIPEVYRRKEYGTDLFVIGFKKSPDWMERVAISVLEHFFYAIEQNYVEVYVKEDDKEIAITKTKLNDLIHEYAEYCEKHGIAFTAPEYWDVLKNNTDQKKVYREKFKALGKTMGEVELHLIVNQNFAEKKVLQMRNSGMSIRVDDKFRLPAYFTGIFIATGNGAKSEKEEDNINSFLRKCENPAHNDWSAMEFEGHEADADKVLKKIHKWILDKVSENIPKNDSPAVDAFGLNDDLPNQYGESDDKQEEEAFMDFVPMPIGNKSKSNSDSRKTITLNVRTHEKGVDGSVVVRDENGDLGSANHDGFGGEGGYKPQPPHPHPPLPGPHPGPFPGPEPTPGPNPGPDPNPGPGEESGVLNGNNPPYNKRKDDNSGANEHKELNNIKLSNIKTPQNGLEYTISFVPGKTAENVHVRLRNVGDDGEKNDIKFTSAKDTNGELAFADGFVIIPSLKKDEKYMFKIKLSEKKRLRLEVAAYA